MARLVLLASPHNQNEIHLDSIIERWPHELAEPDYARMRVVEVIARLSTMLLVAAFLFKSSVCVLHATHLDSFVPIVWNWIWQFPAVVICLASINSTLGRGWKFGQGFAEYAKSTLLLALLSGLFFGLVNAIAWNCVWLIPILSIIGGILSYWSQWHSRIKHLTNAIETYRRHAPL